MIHRHLEKSVSVALLAKAPVQGFCKTRLIPAIGREAAATLQAWLVRHAVDIVQQAGFPLNLWCAPDMKHLFFKQLQAATEGFNLSLHTQCPGDLGEKLFHAAKNATTEAVILIGSDSPALAVSHLHAAADALKTHDAAVIPAEDGGYVLLGIRRAHPDLFQNIDWGSEKVMAQTIAVLKRLDWTVCEFPALWDVDRPEDLPRLARDFPLAPTAQFF